MHRDKFFRANVGAMIVNSKKQVMAFERKRIKGAWQFPQGGIDKNENPKDAVKRELWEETGLDLEKDLRLLAEYPEWLLYELPEEMKSESNKKVGRGQVQRWFLFQVLDDAVQIDLEQVEEKEFANWRWMEMKDLVEIVIDFRKPIYTKLLHWKAK